MERPYTIDHIRHVVIRVQDLEKSVAFYTMLGGELLGERTAGAEIQLAPDEAIILNFDPKYVAAEVPVLHHINFAIRATDFTAVADYLRENNAELERVAPASGTVVVHDPDGNRVEIQVIEHRS